MCIKIFVIKILLLFAFMYSSEAVAKVIYASNYHEAISKTQKKFMDKAKWKYISQQRRYMLNYNNNMWEYDNIHNDTIYVCDVINMNGSIYEEYIITDRYVYSLENVIGHSLKCYVVPHDEQQKNRRLIDYVIHWDVNLFKKWDKTTINDYTVVNAYRIVRLSKHKYQYDFYSFCDNYWIEHDPLDGLD